MTLPSGPRSASRLSARVRAAACCHRCCSSRSSSPSSPRSSTSPRTAAAAAAAAAATTAAWTSSTTKGCSTTAPRAAAATADRAAAAVGARTRRSSAASSRTRYLRYQARRRVPLALDRRTVGGLFSQTLVPRALSDRPARAGLSFLPPSRRHATAAFQNDARDLGHQALCVWIVSFFLVRWIPPLPPTPPGCSPHSSFIVRPRRRRVARPLLRCSRRSACCSPRSRWTRACFATAARRARELRDPHSMVVVTRVAATQSRRRSRSDAVARS